MERRASPTLRLLVLFLVLSYVLSSTAVSATRTLKSFNNEKSVQDLPVQDEIMDLSDSSEELFAVEEGYPERRMDFESTDYPGTGANNHHDPKPPGRA